MSGVTGGYNSPSPGGAAANMATSGSSPDVRAVGSSTPVEHAGSTGSGDGAVDVGVDPASHNFFSPDYRNSRHEDLRQMLEGNKDQQKLEAMKRIIGERRHAHFDHVELRYSSSSYSSSQRFPLRSFTYVQVW